MPPAHAGLALACCAQAELRLVRPAQAYSEARNEALPALAIYVRRRPGRSWRSVVPRRIELDRGGKKPETRAPARPALPRSLLAFRTTARDARQAGGRTGDEAKGSGTRSVFGICA